MIVASTSTVVNVTNFNNAIYFYAKNEPFGEFSNFALFGFHLNNNFYKTVEHYYQSEKFAGTAHQTKIIQAQTPKEAAELGKIKTIPLRANWDEIRNEIMFIGVKAKFDNHPQLQELLLSTRDKLIVENSPYDHYWGIGKNGTGQNQLGQILMEIRAIYLEAKTK